MVPSSFFGSETNPTSVDQGRCRKFKHVWTCCIEKPWKNMKNQVFWCENHVFSSHLWFKSSLNHELSLQTSFQNRWPTNQRAQVLATKSMVVQVQTCKSHMAWYVWKWGISWYIHKNIPKIKTTKQHFAPTRTFAYIQITHSNNITFLSQEDEK